MVRRVSAPKDFGEQPQDKRVDASDVDTIHVLRRLLKKSLKTDIQKAAYITFYVILTNFTLQYLLRCHLISLYVPHISQLPT